MLRRAGVPFMLAALLLLVLLVNKAGVLAPDIKPEIYMAPWREAEALSRAWRESPKLGEPNFNVGLFPVAWLIGLIQSLGIGPDLSMRLLRWALLLIAGWGASRLYTFVAGRHAHRLGRYAAAILFVANPYMLVSGDFLANVLPAALLPWMALFLLQAATRGGWRYPAAAALAFAGMSGMNAAVIPLIQLLCLPALLWFARSGLGVSWRALLSIAAKWMLLVLLLSAYWLVPSVAALGAGSHVTDFSESLEGIAGSSSFGEVIRGVGLWTLYGRDVDGAWQPGFAAYVDNPVVIAASFLIPVMLVMSARVTRGPARLLAVLLAVSAAVLMVGVHPPDSPSPFGRFLLWAFDNVPGFAAFRTTHKVGAVLVLGMALLIALAAPALVRRARKRAPGRVLVTGTAAALVLTTWPAWTGGLYSLPLPVPDYWYDAAADIDEGPMDRRVWFVPGVAQPQYSWSEERPDDLNNAVLARPSFVRITLPESSPYGASLLAALDTQLQEGSLPIGTISSAARYLGVGDVLVRHDVRWDKAGGARPLSVATFVGSDPGLEFKGAYGSPGEGLVQDPDQPDLELTLPPLQHYEVEHGRDLVRTESTDGLVIIDGDGWALAPVSHAGLLPDEPPFLLGGATDLEDMTELLGPETRLVLTDTNRRREVTPNRLTDAYGPIIVPDENAGPSIALFGPDEQTVLRVEGGEVTATQEGARFGIDAASSAENAFDGDPSTAWRFGDFGSGVGQSVSITAPGPVPVDQINIDIPPTHGQRIAEIRIDADEEFRVVEVPADGRVSVAFPGKKAQHLTLTVTDVQGDGDNPLFVADISVPGLEVRRVARLPVSVPRALQDLSPVHETRLSETPLDVVLTRVRGRDPATDDEERRLDRDILLPDTRDFRVYGLVRPDPAASDDTLDNLLGVRGNVVVTSSSRAFNGVSVRASRAFDGDRATGWVPGRAVVGEWLEATFTEPQTLSGIDIEQPEDAAGWVSEVDILVDGRHATSAALTPGRVTIPLPAAASASSVQIRITERQGAGTPVINEIGLAEARVVTDPDSVADECVTLGTISGVPLTARVSGSGDEDGSRVIAGCATLRLGAGEHRLRSNPGWALDSLVLRDVNGEHARPGRTGPPVTVDRRSSSSYRLETEAATEPYLIVVGQNVHPGWRATMDGVDLGPPTVVDGYALGWRISDLDPHVFEVEFAAQEISDVALAVSGGAALLSAGLVLLAPGRRDGRIPVLEKTWPTPARKRTPASAGRDRRYAAWLLFALGCWVFAGLVGLAVGILTAVWHLRRDPAPDTVLKVAAVSMALAPVAWIIGNIPRWGQIGPDLVRHNPAPSVLVICSLVLLVLGSWREKADPHRPTAEENSARETAP